MRSLAAALVLFAATAAQADPRGEAVLARARATEHAQLAALAGKVLSMQTHGTVRNGKQTHSLEAMRTLGVASDGNTIINDYLWGKLDGVSLDENGLRKASGAPKKPAGQAESLTIAMTPFTGPGVEVRPVGPTAGGYLFRVDVHRNAAVSRLDLVVDEATGKKLSADLHPSGTMVKLADRADMRLAYAADGMPAELRSDFAARILWIDRGADMVTTPVR